MLIFFISGHNAAIVMPLMITMDGIADHRSIPPKISSRGENGDEYKIQVSPRL